MKEQAFDAGDDPKPAAEVEKAEEAAKAEPAATPPKQRRGFAAMDRAAVRSIARKGGIAAHARGSAHRFTPEEAQRAGRKGGLAPHRARGRKIRPSNDAGEATTTSAPS